MNELSVSLSSSQIIDFNYGKKRKFNPLEHKNTVNKIAKNCGLQYTGVNGVQHNAKNTPAAVLNAFVSFL